MGSFDYRKFRLFVVQSKLDAEIERHNKQPRPDSYRLTHLKKLRLAVKDCLLGHRKSAEPPNPARGPQWEPRFDY
jgi:uncharacterized protein YdcH (DUF465 family)